VLTQEVVERMWEATYATVTERTREEMDEFFDAVSALVAAQGQPYKCRCAECVEHPTPKPADPKPCPKCGSTEDLLSWCGPQRPGFSHYEHEYRGWPEAQWKGEHMHRVCRRCHYESVEPTMEGA
jgi:hypothetical protein